MQRKPETGQRKNYSTGSMEVGYHTLFLTIAPIVVFGLKNTSSPASTGIVLENPLIVITRIKKSL
jgi:hypothetical protein